MPLSPQVTIITISYNSGRYLRNAIESVLSQSYINFEYIISDDCSSDNSWEIIESYNDVRIKAIRNSKNLGEYPHRNKTLSYIKGKFVMWIDGDDILYPHGLEFMVKMLDAFPNSAMACARPFSPNMVYPVELNPTDTFRFDMFASPVTVNGFPDTLFRTKNLIEIGGLSNNYIAGDTYLKKLLSSKFKILLVSNGISWWRRSPNQASAKLNYGGIGMIENYKMNIELLNLNSPLNKEETANAIRNQKKLLIRYLLKNQLMKGNLMLFIKSYNSSGLKLKDILYVSASIRIEKNVDVTKKFYINDFKTSPYAP